jgi:hypothetical protein
MRLLAGALLVSLLVPVTAAGDDRDAPVRVRWNSTPENLRAGSTWDARLSVLQGPGGFDGGDTRPVIVVTDLAGGAQRRVPLIVDVPPNTFRATVTFPRAGVYRVAAAGFDPRDPARLADVGAPVGIEPALRPATTARGAASASWAWAVVVVAVIAAAGALSIQRVRGLRA